MTAEAERIARAALRYARHGWPVFPLWWPIFDPDGTVRCACPRERDCDRIGKHPIYGGGFHDATTDEAQVRAWWGAHPLANIGHAPGAAGHVVIDIDGPEAMEGAEMLGLPFTPTLTCVTGREGGLHLHFNKPGFGVGNGTSALPPRIDVRGDKGYVLLPPSLHPSGRRYRWDGGTTEIADLPRAALDALRECQEPDEAPAPSTWPPPAPVDRSLLDHRIERYIAAVGHATEGSRNHTAFRVAAMLVRDFALSEMDAWPPLVRWNAHNVPPLSTKELRSCMGSAMRHGRRPIGAGLEREPVKNRIVVNIERRRA